MLMPVFSLVLPAVYTSLHVWHLNSWSHFHSAFNVHTMEVLPRDLALFLIGFQEGNLRMLHGTYKRNTWDMCTWYIIRLK